MEHKHYNLMGKGELNYFLVKREELEPVDGFTTLLLKSELLLPLIEVIFKTNIQFLPIFIIIFRLSHPFVIHAKNFLHTPCKLILRKQFAIRSYNRTGTDQRVHTKIVARFLGSRR